MAQSQGLQNSKTDLFSTRSLNFSGRQIKNAGDATDSQDYVTLAQAKTLIADSVPTTKKPNSVTVSATGVNAGTAGAVLFIGNGGKLASDSGFSFSAGTLKISSIIGDAINLSTLTASRPVKTDGVKNLTSGLINLASANDVTGVLPRTNGGLANNVATAYAGTFTGTISGTASLVTGVVTGTCSGTTSTTI